MVVVVQILLNLPVVFAEIRPPKPKKKINKIKIVHVFGSAFGFGTDVYIHPWFRFGFGFGAYVKALIGLKAFYFFRFG